MVRPSGAPGRDARRPKRRRPGEAARRRRRGCRPALFRPHPRSESWEPVSKTIVNRALTYVFSLHYTGPVLATAIFSPIYKGGSMRSQSGASLAVAAVLALVAAPAW